MCLCGMGLVPYAKCHCHRKPLGPSGNTISKDKEKKKHKQADMVKDAWARRKRHLAIKH